MGYTDKQLSEMKFKGPVRFLDGRNGMAQQDFVCVDEPRFGYFWRRENSKDRGRQAYTVDGDEVPNLVEAARRLALPRDENSHHAQWDRAMAEHDFSPRMADQPMRARTVAVGNANAGPFATLHDFMSRAGGAWHGGINAYADVERSAGREFPHWLYDVKTGAYELSRAMLLFSSDGGRKNKLKCALGVECSTCPILSAIEKPMQHEMEKRPDRVDTADINAAKALTCVGHVLNTPGRSFLDGAMFSTEEDRKEGWL